MVVNIIKARYGLLLYEDCHCFTTVLHLHCLLFYIGRVGVITAITRQICTDLYTGTIEFIAMFIKKQVLLYLFHVNKARLFNINVRVIVVGIKFKSWKIILNEFLRR